MREHTSEDHATWPYIFDNVTMDRSKASHLASQDRLPWLIGVDGRHRGGLHVYEGHKFFDSLGTCHTATITVDNSPLTNLHTITIDGVAITAKDTRTSVDEFVRAPGSTTAIATNIAECLNETFTGAREPAGGAGAILATSSSNVVTINWWPGDTVTPTIAESAGDVTLSGANLTETRVVTNPTVDFCKYIEVRTTANNIARGFVWRDGATGNIWFTYTVGFGSGTFTNTIQVNNNSTNWSAYRMNCTVSGKIVYILGTDGTNTEGRVIYFDSTKGVFFTHNFGIPTGIIGDNSFTAANISISSAIADLTSPPDTVYGHDGEYEMFVRYYDNNRRRWTPLSPSVTFAHATVGTIPCAHQWSMDDDWSPFSANRFDQAEIWSAVSSGTVDGATYVPGGGPLFKRSTRTIISDIWYHQAAVSAIVDSVAENWINGTATRFDSLSDLALSSQFDQYDWLSDLVTQGVPDLEQIEWYGGANFGLANTDGFVDIRWTPLNRIEPENFQALNLKRTRIRAQGVAHFRRSGDYLWVLGDGESYRLQKRGSSLSIHQMLSGYKFVGPNSTTAVGSSIIGVTTSGVLQINGNTGAYTQIAALDRIVLLRWGLNLETDNQDQAIFVEFDERLGAVYIYNRRLGECIILWTSTNRITMITDCWFQCMTSGYIPDDRAGGRRVWFVTENTTQSIDSITQAGGHMLYTEDGTKTDGPNIFGLTTGSGNDIVNITGTPSSVTTVSTNSVLTIATGNTSIVAGRLVGAVMHVLTGALAGNSYKIQASGTESSSVIKIAFTGTEPGTTLTTSDIVSIAPCVLGFLGWPLASNIFRGDILSRRVVDTMTCLVGTTDGTITTTSGYGLFQFGLTRYDQVGDDTVKAQVTGDPLAEATSTFPWTIPTGWEVSTGVSMTVDPSSANQMFTQIAADGAVLMPSFKCVVSGIRYTLLGIYAFGRVEPNQNLVSVT